MNTEKLNKLLLNYIYKKVNYYVKIGNEVMVDKWADIWLAILRSCPEELKKLKNTH